LTGEITHLLRAERPRGGAAVETIIVPHRRRHAVDLRDANAGVAQNVGKQRTRRAFDSHRYVE
jgi:hypothetical protein